jgi:hypothetical protein
VSRPAEPRVPARSPRQAASIGGENRAAGHGWVLTVGDGGTVEARSGTPAMGSLHRLN